MALTTEEQKFIELYNALSVEMVRDDSILDKLTKKLVEEFDGFGLDSAQKSQLLSQLYQQTIISFNKDAIDGVLQVGQKRLIDRQFQGYDDSLLTKVMEQQASVTAYAVNSDSDSAQDAIYDLKNIELRIQSRAGKVNVGESDGVGIRGEILAPANLASSGVTQTGFTVSWEAVQNASAYETYLDGTLASTTSNLYSTYTSLTADTKYAVNVKAIHTDGVTKSQLSETFIVRTLA